MEFGKVSLKAKMYCVFSKPAIDQMKGIRGKLAAMSGHAFLHAYLDSVKKQSHDFGINEYYIDDPDSTKIVCVVDTDLELEKLYAKYQEFDKTIGLYMVTDAGYTVFDRPTKVCLGIGPIYEDEQRLVKNLKLLR